jgi:nucleoside-diphosphate-sugar epimerase
MMKALVTGANGFIGAHLCRFLLGHGAGVRALVRRASDLSLLRMLVPEDGRLELVRGDLERPGSFTEALRDRQVVFHVAGVLSGFRQSDYDQVNVRGTAHLLQALLAANPGVERVVIVSSLAAAGPSPAGRLNSEEMPGRPLPGDRYGRSKWRMEKVARAYSDRLPVVIARPSTVLGPGDRTSLLLFQTARYGLELAATGWPRVYSLVDVEDLCAGLLLCAWHPRAAGELFYFSSGEPLEWGGLQRLIGREVFGLGEGAMLRVSVPPAAVLAAGALMELAGRVLGRAPFLNRSKLRESLASGWACSSRKSRELLGWTPRFDPPAMVRRAGSWYRAHGWLGGPSPAGGRGGVTAGEKSTRLADF